MKTNKLYKEYARIIEMCEGTELEDTPWVCVKVDGRIHSQFGMRHPDFSFTGLNWDFAVAVLEGKPVFAGDTIYYKCDGEKAKAIAVDDDIIIVKDDRGESVFHPDDFTWQWTPPAPELPAPKRTFTLNGVDLPCPEERTQDENILFFSFDVGLETFYFQLIEDRDKTCKALINLLTEARDK